MSSSFSRTDAVTSAGKVTSIRADRDSTVLADAVAHGEAEILSEWVRNMSTATRRSDLIKDAELQRQCALLLSLMKTAVKAAGPRFPSSAFDEVRAMLGDLSRTRAHQGFTSSETAMFVFSAKQPLLKQIRGVCNSNVETLAAESWAVTELLDAMGLYTAEEFQKTREDIIKRQQEELLELSTPVVKLWDGILALPVVGTLDSARTQVLMESLLQAIVDTNCRVAILDITGVPTVDTVVAQHLLKTVTAARLMGAECIISGARPQIAQTIVHLGISLTDVITKATLSAALRVALDSLNIQVTRSTKTA